MCRITVLWSWCFPFVFLLQRSVVVVDGQSFGKCPKMETMKNFDPKQVSAIMPEYYLIWIGGVARDLNAPGKLQILCPRSFFSYDIYIYLKYFPYSEFELYNLYFPLKNTMLTLIVNDTNYNSPYLYKQIIVTIKCPFY